MDEALEGMLRTWGRVYGPPPPDEWAEDSSLGAGALTGCLIEFMRVGIVYGRESDKLTARGRESQGGAKPMKAHPVADQIDHLCVALYAENRIRAVVLRANYCIRGPRAEKLPWVSKAVNQRISRRRYCTELDAARDWMGGRLGLVARRSA
jgi:hypothetical protein